MWECVCPTKNEIKLYIDFVIDCLFFVHYVVDVAYRNQFIPKATYQHYCLCVFDFELCHSYV